MEETTKPEIDWKTKAEASEKERDRLREENEQLKEESQNETTEDNQEDNSEDNSEEESSDEDIVLEVATATAGLDRVGIAELKFRAEATGKTLGEARKDEAFGTWKKGYDDKLAEEKALEPTTGQDEVDKQPEGIEEELKKAKTQDEKEKVLNKYGINPLTPF